MALPGAIAPKWTDAEIREMYDEWKMSDKPLRQWINEKGMFQHYSAIRKRFRRLEKASPGEEVPTETRGVVRATVEEEIAKRQRKETEMKLMLGEVCWSAYLQWGAKRGMNIEQMKKVPIHKAILRALERDVDYESLLKENTELKGALQIYTREVDPLFRLEKAVDLLSDFLEMVCVADLLGFNVKDSGLVDYYQNLLELYLTGGNE